LANSTIAVCWPNYLLRACQTRTCHGGEHLCAHLSEAAHC
jgi:hypothetical protein